MTKENSIKIVKAINSFMFLLLVIFSCNAQKRPVESTQVSYRIIFGDRFDNDTIKLYVNDFVVFENENLFSDRSDGLTNSWLNISQDSKCFFVSSSQKKELKRMGLASNVIKIGIVYKEKTMEFQVSAEKGKYIVFSDDGKGNLTFRQSNDKPIFD